MCTSSHLVYNYELHQVTKYNITVTSNQVLHEIGESLDKRIQTRILYFDFAKAFDRVEIKNQINQEIT